MIDAILVDSGLRDYEINLDSRFSSEPANPPGQFICKTGTEQHKTGPADFLKNSGKNRPGVHGYKIEINSSWTLESFHLVALRLATRFVEFPTIPDEAEVLLD
jgi:hypothetical protein